MARDVGLRPKVKLGQVVTILQNAIEGRVVSQWRQEGQPWQYGVRSVTATTALTNDWLRCDEFTFVESADAPLEGEAA